MVLFLSVLYLRLAFGRIFTKDYIIFWYPVLSMWKWEEVVGTGCSWLRIETGGGRLWVR